MLTLFVHICIFKRMGFNYKPLFKLLIDRNMKKTDLRREVGLSSATLAKLSKGEPLSGANIEKLCAYFRCPVADVIEITWDDDPKPAEEAVVRAAPKKRTVKHGRVSKTSRAASGTARSKT